MPKTNPSIYADKTIISSVQLGQRVTDKQSHHWLMDTRNLYKIWISKDPNQFLPLINQVRMIRMRDANPEATISLIYSAESLSIGTRVALNHFAKKYNIKLIDFEGIRQHLSDQTDISLWEYAKEEIEAAKTGTGNLASASDIIRVITYVIKNYGQYSDFDIILKFGCLPEKIAIQFPILTNSQHQTLDEKKLIQRNNNDFLGFAINVDKPSELSPNAIHRLKYLQNTILWRRNNLSHLQTIRNNIFTDAVTDYLLTKNAFTDHQAYRAALNTLNLDTYIFFIYQQVEKYSKQPLLHLLLQNTRQYHHWQFVYLAKNEPPYHTPDKGLMFDAIYDATKHPTTMAEEFLAHIKMEIFTRAVMLTTGPYTYDTLFKYDTEQLPAEEIKMDPLGMTDFKSLALGSSFMNAEKNGLDKHIIIDNALVTTGIDDPAHCHGDLSWQPEGQAVIAEAANVMEQSARTILRAMIAYRAHCQSKPLRSHQTRVNTTSTSCHTYRA